jgi:hypothetical protein
MNESQAIPTAGLSYGRAVMVDRAGLTAQEIAKLQAAIAEASSVVSHDPASSAERRLGGELP